MRDGPEIFGCPRRVGHHLRRQRREDRGDHGKVPETDGEDDTLRRDVLAGVERDVEAIVDPRHVGDMHLLHVWDELLLKPVAVVCKRGRRNGLEILEASVATVLRQRVMEFRRGNARREAEGFQEQSGRHRSPRPHGKPEDPARNAFVRQIRGDREPVRTRTDDNDVNYAWLHLPSLESRAVRA